MMQSQKGPPRCWRRLSRLVTGEPTAPQGRSRRIQESLLASLVLRIDVIDVFFEGSSRGRLGAELAPLFRTLPLGCYSMLEICQDFMFQIAKPRKIVPPTKLRLRR